MFPRTRMRRMRKDEFSRALMRENRLSAADLGERYALKSYADPAEYYAPEEDWSAYEDDNNEPY